MKRPNVLFFLVDDTMPNLLGIYGKSGPTPFINEFSKNSVVFQNAYCTSSVCTPSRYSYLTGQYASRCNDPSFLRKNPNHDICNIGWDAVLHESMPSMGSYFKSAGYSTGFSGKWHIGKTYKELHLPEIPDNRDPDTSETDLFLEEVQSILQKEVRTTGGFDFAGGVIWGNNEAQLLPHLRNHHPEFSVDAAIEFLEDQTEDKPFALHYASTCFHGPPMEDTLKAEARYTPGGRNDKVSELPGRDTLAKRLEDMGFPVNHETLSLLSMDDQFRVIMEKLDDKGFYANTIIVFGSDHNTEPGKGTCYEGGIHIPLMIHYAKGYSHFQSIEGAVQNIDLLPSLLQMCSIRFDPDEMDGISFLPLLNSEKKVTRDFLYFEMGYMRAIRADGFKYITFRYPQKQIQEMENEGKEAPNHLNMRLQGQACIAVSHYKHYFDSDQFYDLSKDPEEQNNLMDDPQHAERIQWYQNRLKQVIDKLPHPYPLESHSHQHSEKFSQQCEQTRCIGTDHIPWWPKS